MLGDPIQIEQEEIGRLTQFLTMVFLSIVLICVAKFNEWKQARAVLVFEGIPEMSEEHPGKEYRAKLQMAIGPSESKTIQC